MPPPQGPPGPPGPPGAFGPPGPPGPPPKPAPKSRRGCLLALIGLPLLLIALAAVGWFVVVPRIAPDGAFAEAPDACAVLPEQAVAEAMPQAVRDEDRQISGSFDSVCPWTTDRSDRVGQLDVTILHETRAGLEGGEEVAQEFIKSTSASGEITTLPGIGDEARIRSLPAPQGESSDSVDVRVSNVVATATYSGPALPEEKLAGLAEAMAEGLEAERDD